MDELGMLGVPHLRKPPYGDSYLVLQISSTFGISNTYLRSKLGESSGINRWNLAGLPPFTGEGGLMGSFHLKTQGKKGRKIQGPTTKLSAPKHGLQTSWHGKRDECRSSTPLGRMAWMPAPWMLGRCHVVTMESGGSFFPPYPLVN